MGLIAGSGDTVSVSRRGVNCAPVLARAARLSLVALSPEPVCIIELGFSVYAESMVNGELPIDRPIPAPGVSWTVGWGLEDGRSEPDSSL